MPNINDIVTYNAVANGSPTSPVTWGSWIISPGSQGTDYNIISGGGTNSNIEIQWLTVNNYTISTTADNCGPAVQGSVSINVTNGSGCTTPTPTNGSAAIVSQTASTYTVNVQATNGSTFDFCVGTPNINCTWNCTPSANGCGTFAVGNHTFNKGSNSDACITYRVYNDCCTSYVEFTENYSGIGLVSCSVPSSVLISNTSNIFALSQTTHSINPTGGTGYAIQWTVVGGTIQGSSTGSSVTILWGSGHSAAFDGSIHVQLVCGAGGVGNELGQTALIDLKQNCLLVSFTNNSGVDRTLTVNYSGNNTATCNYATNGSTHTLLANAALNLCLPDFTTAPSGDAVSVGDSLSGFVFISNNMSGPQYTSGPVTSSFVSSCN